MHHLLLSVLVIFFIPIGVDSTPTSSPTSNNEQQLQLTDVSAICDPAIAAITAWLVLVIVSLFRYDAHVCYVFCILGKITSYVYTISYAHIMCSHFLFLLLTILVIAHAMCSSHHRLLSYLLYTICFFRLWR